MQFTGFLQLNQETMGVPVADASAMYLDLARKASFAGRRTRSALICLPLGTSTPKRSVSDAGEQEYIDGLQDIMASVVFSYTAIEAFANSMIPPEFVHRRQRSDKRCTEEYDRIQIERHLSLGEKLHEVLPAITKIASTRGTTAWERFASLEKLRNRLIHLKRSDWRDKQHPENAVDSVWSALLAPEVASIYKTAVDMVWHFTANDRPRWVVRIREMADADEA